MKNNVIRVALMAVALFGMNMPALRALNCIANPGPGQTCIVTTSCFGGVCHCVVVCGPGGDS